MNPYLRACQCDIYVGRYCVAERVIGIFLSAIQRRVSHSLLLDSSLSIRDSSSLSFLLPPFFPSLKSHRDGSPRTAESPPRSLTKFIRASVHTYVSTYTYMHVDSLPEVSTFLSGRAKSGISMKSTG